MPRVTDARSFPFDRVCRWQSRPLRQELLLVLHLNVLLLAAGRSVPTQPSRDQLAVQTAPCHRPSRDQLAVCRLHLAIEFPVRICSLPKRAHA
jgi:hypothetical protein